MPETLLDRLESVVGTDPQRALLVTDAATLSYSDVADRVRSVAAGLAADQIERFGIACATPVDTVVALIAASATGAEACVYPRCDLRNSELIASEFSHTTVVVTDAVDGFVEALPLSSLERATIDLAAPTADPVLILTSGTTGRPKGTRHQWSRLLQAAHAEPAGETHRWLLAYNLNQYAGLQVLLHVIGSSGTLVIPESPQPRHAIAAMRAHDVTHASATPTFWRFAIQMLHDQDQPLPHLKHVTLGGEAIDDGLLDGMKRLFPDVRISQIYASSEFGSSVSVTDGRAGLPVAVLSRPPNAPVHFRVVDGELQARSNIGMLGYYGTDDRDDGWHPTGDLVEVDDDRIRFVGRTTEVINVGGVKVYPLPIESIVAAVPGVVAAVVYGSPNPVTGNIVAADVIPDSGVDQTELKAQIQAAVKDLPPAQRPRRIRMVESFDLPNQKLRRTAETPS